MNEELKVQLLIPANLAAFVDFKNKLSVEDTYIAQSGEILSEETEQSAFELLLKDVKNNDAVEITLWHEDMIVGHAKIWRMNKYKRNMHVGCCSIVLLKEWRGKGCGKKLMKGIIDKAKSNIAELKILTLTTYSNNTVAMSLYKSLGFKEWERLPGAVYFKGEYVDQVEMYRIL